MSYTIESSPVEKRSKIELLRVAVLPDESADALKRRYAPLLEHLARETGRQFRLVVPESYADLLEKFARKEVEIAYFGGLTFVMAHVRHHARPLVMRDLDSRFTTIFVTRAESPLRGCANLKCKALKGKTLSFGSRLSTSGHLMPRHYLNSELSVEPEQYFSDVLYSGAHDKTAYDVRDGKADVGAINSEIFRTMLRDGRLDQESLRVVWQTPPYPDYVWATSEDVSRELRTKLRDAFMKLEFRDKNHQRVLTAMGAQTFLPAGNGMFGPLRNVAKSLELLGSDR